MVLSVASQTFFYFTVWLFLFRFVALEITRKKNVVQLLDNKITDNLEKLFSNNAISFEDSAFPFTGSLQAKLDSCDHFRLF